MSLVCSSTINKVLFYAYEIIKDVFIGTDNYTKIKRSPRFFNYIREKEPMHKIKITMLINSIVITQSNNIDNIMVDCKACVVYYPQMNWEDSKINNEIYNILDYIISNFLNHPGK